MLRSMKIDNKFSFYTFVLLFSFFLPLTLSAQKENKRELKVRVVEAENHDPIIGAVVRLEENSAITNSKGIAALMWPRGRKAHLLVHSLGFKQEQLTLTTDDIIDDAIVVELETLVLDEVVVTTDKRRRESTTVAVRMSQAQIKENVGKNLAEVLQQIPGMSSISSGATIMKPVIQGMHSSRILLINNGVRQEGQQWGADHAPELDASSSTDIEIIKGAESIRYGAGAIGGVILLNSATLPEDKLLRGKVLLRGASNAGSIGLNADLQGGTPIEGWRWRAQASSQMAGDYSTAQYVLNNTGLREGGATLATGLQRKNYKVEGFASLYYAQLGVFFGSHIGTLDDLLARFEIGRPVETAPSSYRIINPKQEVKHYIARLSGEYSMGYAGTLKGQYDFQSDARNEYENRPGRFQTSPAMGLFLSTHAGHLSWESDQHNALRFIVGTSLLWQQNENRKDTGAVPLIPNFGSFNIGGYGIAKYVQTRYELEVGARYDYKYLDAKGYNNLGRFYGGEKQFSSPSFSASGMVRLSQRLALSSNLGLAWRAPDVNELYSSGLHHGAASYELGDEYLTPEAAWKWNNELRYTGNKLSVTATAFGQWIRNYIYDAPQIDSSTGLPEVQELLAGVFPIFRYKQANALFFGGDIALSVAPIDGLKYTAEAQWIRAKNLDTKGYFPFIPSDRYSQRIDWTPSLHRKGFPRLTLSLNHLFVTKQKNFDQSIDFLPTTPDAYHIFGSSIGAQWTWGKNSLEILLKADNLFNKLYKEYTNRFRYYAHEKGRDIQFVMSYHF